MPVARPVRLRYHQSGGSRSPAQRQRQGGVRTLSYRKSRPDPQTGVQQNGTVLEIAESSEPIIRLKLEDGTLVRLKVSIIEVMRMDQPDENGKAIYDLNANLTVSFVEPKDILDG